MCSNEVGTCTCAPEYTNEGPQVEWVSSEVFRTDAVPLTKLLLKESPNSGPESGLLGRDMINLKDIEDIKFTFPHLDYCGKTIETILRSCTLRISIHVQYDWSTPIFSLHEEVEGSRRTSVEPVLASKVVDRPLPMADSVLGSVAVSLYLLSSAEAGICSNIDGWYHVIDNAQRCHGQMKLQVLFNKSSHENDSVPLPETDNSYIYPDTEADSSEVESLRSKLEKALLSMDTEMKSYVYNGYMLRGDNIRSCYIEEAPQPTTASSQFLIDSNSDIESVNRAVSAQTDIVVDVCNNASVSGIESVDEAAPCQADIGIDLGEACDYDLISSEAQLGADETGHSTITIGQPSVDSVSGIESVDEAAPCEADIGIDLGEACDYDLISSEAQLGADETGHSTITIGQPSVDSVSGIESVVGGSDVESCTGSDNLDLDNSRLSFIAGTLEEDDESWPEWSQLDAKETECGNRFLDDTHHPPATHADCSKPSYSDLVSSTAERAEDKNSINDVSDITQKPHNDLPVYNEFWSGYKVNDEKLEKPENKQEVPYIAETKYENDLPVHQFCDTKLDMKTLKDKKTVDFLPKEMLTSDSSNIESSCDDGLLLNNSVTSDVVISYESGNSADESSNTTCNTNELVLGVNDKEGDIDVTMSSPDSAVCMNDSIDLTDESNQVFSEPLISKLHSLPQDDFASSIFQKADQLDMEPKNNEPLPGSTANTLKPTVTKHSRELGPRTSSLEHVNIAQLVNDVLRAYGSNGSINETESRIDGVLPNYPGRRRRFVDKEVSRISKIMLKTGST